jgi:hypothetical protein
VLFDIDATLLDSNYPHSHACCRTFAEVGVGVQSWRIRRSIGMDGSELVKFLIAAAGESPAACVGTELQVLPRRRAAASCIARCPRPLSASRSSGSAGGARHVGTRRRKSTLRKLLGGEDIVLDGYVVRRCPDRQTRSRHRRDRSSTSVRVGVACRVRRRFRVGGESRCVLHEITTSRRAVTQTIAVELYDQGASAIRFPLAWTATLASLSSRGAQSVRRGIPWRSPTRHRSKSPTSLRGTSRWRLIPQ